MTAGRPSAAAATRQRRPSGNREEGCARHRGRRSGAGRAQLGPKRSGAGHQGGRGHSMQSRALDPAAAMNAALRLLAVRGDQHLEDVAHAVEAISAWASSAFRPCVGDVVPMALDAEAALGFFIVVAAASEQQDWRSAHMVAVCLRRVIASDETVGIRALQASTNTNTKVAAPMTALIQALTAAASCGNDAIAGGADDEAASARAVQHALTLSSLCDCVQRLLPTWPGGESAFAEALLVGEFSSTPFAAGSAGESSGGRVPMLLRAAATFGSMEDVGGWVAFAALQARRGVAEVLAAALEDLPSGHKEECELRLVLDEPLAVKPAAALLVEALVSDCPDPVLHVALLELLWRGARRTSEEWLAARMAVEIFDQAASKDAGSLSYAAFRTLTAREVLEHGAALVDHISRCKRTIARFQCRCRVVCGSLQIADCVVTTSAHSLLLEGSWNDEEAKLELPRACFHLINDAAAWSAWPVRLHIDCEMAHSLQSISDKMGHALQAERTLAAEFVELRLHCTQVADPAGPNDAALEEAMARALRRELSGSDGDDGCILSEAAVEDSAPAATVETVIEAPRPDERVGDLCQLKSVGRPRADEAATVRTTSADFCHASHAELQAMCESRGLSPDGTRVDLAVRLVISQLSTDDMPEHGSHQHGKRDYADGICSQRRPVYEEEEEVEEEEERERANELTGDAVEGEEEEPRIVEEEELEQARDVSSEAGGKSPVWKEVTLATEHSSPGDAAAAAAEAHVAGATMEAPAVAYKVSYVDDVKAPSSAGNCVVGSDENGLGAVAQADQYVAVRHGDFGNLGNGIGRVGAAADTEDAGSWFPSSSTGARPPGTMSNVGTTCSTTAWQGGDGDTSAPRRQGEATPSCGGVDDASTARRGRDVPVERSSGPTLVEVSAMESVRSLLNLHSSSTSIPRWYGKGVPVKLSENRDLPKAAKMGNMAHDITDPATFMFGSSCQRLLGLRPERAMTSKGHLLGRIRESLCHGWTKNGKVCRCAGKHWPDGALFLYCRRHARDWLQCERYTAHRPGGATRGRKLCAPRNKAVKK